MKPLVYGSVCSGIEAASMAWTPLGWRGAFFAEIEAFPRAVLKHHHPEVPLHGDFTTIQAGDYEPIDVLVGGTPCQSFSVAGLRGGLADERGNLALEYLRLADRLRPRWLCWENVPGVLSSSGGRDFGVFLGGLGELGYGWSYRVLDAQFFGVAQRRRRVFVVGYLGDWRRAAAVLFDPASLSGNPAPRRETRQGIARPIAAGSPSGSGYRNDADTADNLIAFTAKDSSVNAGSEVFPTLQSADRGHGASLAVAFLSKGHGGNRPSARGGDLVAFDTTQVTSATNRSNPQAGDPCHPLSAGAHAPAIAASAVRRLTPRECERLQGFPDDYTLIPWRSGMAPDGPRYRALGNSMAVPVMAWVGERIQHVEYPAQPVELVAAE